MVKCSECGYLALRNLETVALAEADSMFREIGRPIEPSNALPLNSAFDFFPICFSQQINFVQEFSDAGAKRHPVEGEPNPYGVIAAIINAERECTKFTGWQQGFTPKEHREILDRQWMTDR